MITMQFDFDTFVFHIPLKKSYHVKHSSLHFLRRPQPNLEKTPAL